jgi:hypothetical protein
MGILEITSVTTRFVVAEMEYVGLIEQSVDFEAKGLKGLSPEELRLVRAAKKKRDALEKEMWAVWEDYVR